MSVVASPPPATPATNRKVETSPSLTPKMISRLTRKKRKRRINITQTIKEACFSHFRRHRTHDLDTLDDTGRFLQKFPGRKGVTKRKQGRNLEKKKEIGEREGKREPGARIDRKRWRLGNEQKQIINLKERF
jgi:hypothetical protein